MTATATPTLTDHSVGVFATHDQAEAAIESLYRSGYNMKNLSIVAQNYQTEEHLVGFVNTGVRIWSWGKYGAFWGCALANIGVPKDAVVEYESAVKAGSFLVLALGTESEVNGAKEILSKTPATRVDSYSTEHKQHAGCH